MVASVLVENVIEVGERRNPGGSKINEVFSFLMESGLRCRESSTMRMDCFDARPCARNGHLGHIHLASRLMRARDR
jgi:hypothetical protein